MFYIAKIARNGHTPNTKCRILAFNEKKNGKNSLFIVFFRNFAPYYVSRIATVIYGKAEK